jgi:transcription initiation factor TFIIIB Brf1 subunit/transcription initiation factor TFIIB
MAMYTDQNNEIDEVDEFNDEDLFDTLDVIHKVDKIKKTSACVNCESTNITNDYSKGCKRCIDCGSCTGQLFDEKAEWSVYEDGKNEGSARCGQPTSFFFPKSSMCSNIGGRQNSIIKTLQLWIKMPYNEYSLSKILQFIEHICSKHYLPKSVIDNAKLLYKQVHDTRIIIRGPRRRNGIYGACMFYGAQMQKYYRSPAEIGIMLDMPEKVITNGCNKLKKILRTNKLLNSIIPTTPTDFMERFCYKLEFNRIQIDEIYVLTNNVTKLYLASNHQPMSIAAGCVLIYDHIKKLNMSKKHILDTFNITAVTTDKIFSKILPFCDVIVSDKIADMVRDKLIESKYIAVDSGLQDRLNSRTEEFKQELMELNKDIFETELEEEDFDIELERFQMEQDRIASKKKTRQKKID